MALQLTDQQLLTLLPSNYWHYYEPYNNQQYHHVNGSIMKGATTIGTTLQVIIDTSGTITKDRTMQTVIHPSLHHYAQSGLTQCSGTIIQSFTHEFIIYLSQDCST